MEQVLLVMTNVPDTMVAEKIAQTILENKLAACVNILPAVRSLYTWQGNLQTATESTLLIKSTSSHYPELQTRIQHLHPYEVPEIIAIPLANGLPAYLQWVIEETRRP